MSGYSRSPRLIKGALVAFRPPSPLPAVIAFQINPESLSRTLEARSAEGGGGAETFRLAGAPNETIKLEAVLDATDDLERDDPVAAEVGLHPRLAALEMLLYPQSSTVIANSVLMALGTLEVLPMSGPFTVFIWGRSRILPVRLAGLSITEEAHDPALNPIRARVSMDLAVLSYSDLRITHPGYAMFLGHQVLKETMARTGQADGLGAVLGSDVNLL